MIEKMSLQLCIRRIILRFGRPAAYIAALAAVVVLVIAAAGGLMAHVAESSASMNPAGYASSSVIGCLPVGIDYLGSANPRGPYAISDTVELRWTGAAVTATLVAYEFNALSQWGHNIYVNGRLVGVATGTRNS